MHTVTVISKEISKAFNFCIYLSLLRVIIERLEMIYLNIMIIHKIDLGQSFANMVKIAQKLRNYEIYAWEQST